MDLKLNDSTRRMIRTILDVALSWAILLVLILPLFGSFIEDIGGWDSAMAIVAKVGVILTALVGFVSKLRNLLEDRGVIPAVLKAPASQGADPAPGNLPVLPPDVPQNPDEGDYIGEHRA